jgi:lipopolysaccharide biosynthesis protein
LKVISFYLPQFHPIPENDAWWGKGFTEWTNVAKARPLFSGHQQPHIPADLGFYDLRLEETRIAQAELAREHGLGGFCYYHYWFNGKMLLGRPFNEVLVSGKPDFPFCLCWANENWTRSWDGLEQEVLGRQEYSAYDPAMHADWLVKAFLDQRYIRVNGRPLFLVYRADHIPDLDNVVRTWRKQATDKGLPALYLCAVKNNQYVLSDADTIKAGFDAIVEFQPNPKDLQGTAINLKLVTMLRWLNCIIDKFKLGKILEKKSDYVAYDYAKIVEKAIQRPIPAHKTFPCIFPSWDNSSRRRFGITVIQNNDSLLYAKWLADSLGRVDEYEAEEKIVFINAWNEWAEGCHLEPDLQNGRRFLEATMDTLNKFRALQTDVNV